VHSIFNTQEFNSHYFSHLFNQLTG